MHTVSGSIVAQIALELQFLMLADSRTTANFASRPLRPMAAEYAPWRIFGMPQPARPAWRRRCARRVPARCYLLCLCFLNTWRCRPCIWWHESWLVRIQTHSNLNVWVMYATYAKYATGICGSSSANATLLVATLHVYCGWRCLVRTHGMKKWLGPPLSLWTGFRFPGFVTISQLFSLTVYTSHNLDWNVTEGSQSWLITETKTPVTTNAVWTSKTRVGPKQLELKNSFKKQVCTHKRVFCSVLPNESQSWLGGRSHDSWLMTWLWP